MAVVVGKGRGINALEKLKLYQADLFLTPPPTPNGTVKSSQATRKKENKGRGIAWMKLQADYKSRGEILLLREQDGKPFSADIIISCL